MGTFEIALITVFSCVAFGLLAACLAVLGCAIRDTRRARAAAESQPRRTLKELWAAYKPSKRRLIQVYAALLANANIKGFFSGRIYSGNTKYACVPGLNCYSCPGAVGACPLGALQNALASSGTRAPYYVLGILMLFGVLLARTICGFLCPFGLFQDLLYKIRTPKLKKSRFTRALSYLKYVLLAVFVVSIPIMFGLDAHAVPAFCKYICPAGTLGGAVGLLIHPDNASLYGMLGGLFSWKFLVLILVVLGCVFVFRGFCRFLCPLGALYGFFNRISLLGVRLDKNKCTDCGLCVSFCKMDVRHVGDRECIQCGECIAVCPAKAISFKGSKLLLHANAVPVEEVSRPLGALLERGEAPAAQAVVPQTVEAPAALVTENGAPMSAEGHEKRKTPKKPHKRPATFWMQVAAWSAALALLVGALVYYNLPSGPMQLSDLAATHYFMAVSSKDGEAATLSFTISDGVADGKAVYTGEGTEDEPFLLRTLTGKYDVEVAAGETVYFAYEETSERSYTVTSESEQLSLTVRYYDTALQTSEPVAIPLFTLRGTAPQTLRLAPVAKFGANEGDLCFDFTLDTYFGGAPFTLSDHRGKIVLINFWYTQCGPCVEEMPTLSQIAAQHRDDMVVLAVHSHHMYENPATPEGVQAWLDARGWQDFSVTFAQDVGPQDDPNLSFLFSALGGKDSYPVSVVVGRDGKIAFAREGKVDAAFRARLESLFRT